MFSPILIYTRHVGAHGFLSNGMAAFPKHFRSHWGYLFGLSGKGIPFSTQMRFWRMTPLDWPGKPIAFQALTSYADRLGQCGIADFFKIEIWPAW